MQSQGKHTRCKKVANMGEAQQSENMTEGLESVREKQWGHTKGQTNLEHIIQRTLWDHTTMLHFPFATPTVLMMSYHSRLLHSYITPHSPGQTAQRQAMTINS